MKIGDRVPVQIEGTNVAEAIVEDIDEGNAVLIIPATRLVVKMRATLDLAATKEPEVDRVFAGLESTGTNESEASLTTNAEGSPAGPQEVSEGSVGEGIHSKTNFPGEMQ